MISSFDDWRQEARRLVLAGVAPHEADWQGNTGLLDGLLDATGSGDPPRTLRIPRALPELLASAARFRAEDRWALLYRVLWRVVTGDRSAILAGDSDGSELHRRIKAVRREAHHLHAFLRFRPCQATEVEFIAWHEPAHEVLDLGAEHFIGRMGRTRWAIATPDGAACFDGHALHYRHPCPPALTRLAKVVDERGDALWQTYYQSTFNPARLNEKAMRGHMPVRFWQHLPEARLIPQMVSEARAGQQRLAQAADVGERDGKAVLIARERAQPARPTTSALQDCQACAIWRNATCAVPGEGPQQASIMLIGEQPGDLEDLAGRPFVGPAGQVLNDALLAAGLERDALYLTNAVKHFKWEPRGGSTSRGATRLHATPKPAEIQACRPWLDEELNRIRPRVVVALGRTALASVLKMHDPQRIRLADFGGQAIRHEHFWLLVAPHPAAILRSRGDAEVRLAELVAALEQANRLAHEA
ncbi:UdgX family uracil-DNA binding protein [Stutzerimonas azotifigens]|uniref:UdgX family uracil-DNA binding protein n=1 Tax=Stutzerimonas azotifigens TaxID=291995 RepID=UPI00280C2E52|nr:UdgX family uracil-DNA binding protein [Stutzerimonas azotifigens]